MSKSLRTLIERYARACIDVSWAGSDPDDRGCAEHILAQVAQELNARLAELGVPGGPLSQTLHKE